MWVLIEGYGNLTIVDTMYESNDIPSDNHILYPILSTCID
jgi:hypothetical protein